MSMVVLSQENYEGPEPMVSAADGVPSPDVVIIGDGLIGLSTALALGRVGIRTTVIGRRRDGVASTAAAGLLVPSIGTLPRAVTPFFEASLAMYPDFIGGLHAFDPQLRIIPGVLERSGTGKDRMHERDGAVDNVRLVAAIGAAVDNTETVRRLDDEVSRVEAGPSSVTVTTSSGRTISAPRAVLAAGAWSPRIAGLPRTVPVRPLKGQMLALGAAPLTYSIMGDEVYLVPRGRETLVGATVEEAGFDTSVDAAVIEEMRRAAVGLCPELRDAPVTRTWSGIRPATPDMLPIIGPDPEVPSLLYACGHSKNGILLAPATAAALADVVQRDESRLDLRPFRIDRWPADRQ